jgi:hypothetical protein
MQQAVPPLVLSWPYVSSSVEYNGTPPPQSPIHGSQTIHRATSLLHSCTSQAPPVEQHHTHLHSLCEATSVPWQQPPLALNSSCSLTRAYRPHCPGTSMVARHCGAVPGTCYRSGHGMAADLQVLIMGVASWG